MLEKLIKNTKVKLANCILAAMLSGAVNLKCGETEYEPLVAELNYSSYSSENSVNKVFVTGEEIDVFVKLVEGADKVYIEEERQNRNNTTNSFYEMNKIGENSYTYKLNASSDASILCFTIKVNRGGVYESSGKTCEPILVSEKDAFDIIKNWLDSLNTGLEKNIVDYKENERIDKYSNLSIEADFNLKKDEGIPLPLGYDAIIEYVGENDKYMDAIGEEDKLYDYEIINMYVYPFYYLVEDFPTPNDLTTKQDLENKVEDFYYSLYLLISNIQ